MPAFAVPMAAKIKSQGRNTSLAESCRKPRKEATLLARHAAAVNHHNGSSHWIGRGHQITDKMQTIASTDADTPLGHLLQLSSSVMRPVRLIVAGRYPRGPAHCYGSSRTSGRRSAARCMSAPPTGCVRGGGCGRRSLLWAEIADHIAEVITTGTPNQRKALIEAHVAHVSISGPDRLIPMFYIPNQLPRTPQPRPHPPYQQKRPRKWQAMGSPSDAPRHGGRHRCVSTPRSSANPTA